MAKTAQDRRRTNGTAPPVKPRRIVKARRVKVTHFVPWSSMSPNLSQTLGKEKNDKVITLMVEKVSGGRGGGGERLARTFEEASDGTLVQ